MDLTRQRITAHLLSTTVQKQPTGLINVMENIAFKYICHLEKTSVKKRLRRVALSLFGFHPISDIKFSDILFKV